MPNYNMISQAEVIRALVNRSCLDESVMSMALSPDCTAPKLLEKLTDTERFDLALDMSMKLGLDVIPLWRTWAMRSLKGRNFSNARDKFRHCFPRLRQSNRSNVSQLKLLSDILNQLVSMDEIQLPLAQEIELIKQRNQSSHSAIDQQQQQQHNSDMRLSSPLLCKPTIYQECIYYLSEYGSVEDYVRFYIKNQLLDEAVKVLLEIDAKQNLERFITSEVLPSLTSTGQLERMISAFVRLDPNFDRSARFFKYIYDRFRRTRRFNCLYYVQVSIGDFLAAADTQIEHFFLRRPYKDYRELNHRVASLQLARQNYQHYLEYLKNDNEKCNANLFKTLAQDKVQAKIECLDLQADLTKNFALNEVSGCMNNVQVQDDANVGPKMMTTTMKDQLDGGSLAADCPVTLFDASVRRKTFLAALVLTYFDVSGSSTSYSRSGLDLANKLIKTYQLNKSSVFKTSMRIIIEDESCDILESASLLMDRIREDYLASQLEEQQQQSWAGVGTKKTSTAVRTSASPVASAPSAGAAGAAAGVEAKVRAICDEIIKDSIRVCREPDYKMELAKLLSSDAKIELYIEHGKLSNAQRLACKMNRADYVCSIIEEAERLNQNHIKTVCQLWLAKNDTRKSGSSKTRL